MQPLPLYRRAARVRGERAERALAGDVRRPAAVRHPARAARLAGGGGHAGRWPGAGAHVCAAWWRGVVWPAALVSARGKRVIKSKRRAAATSQSIRQSRRIPTTTSHQSPHISTINQANTNLTQSYLHISFPLFACSDPGQEAGQVHGRRGGRHQGPDGRPDPGL